MTADVSMSNEAGRGVPCKLRIDEPLKGRIVVLKPLAEGHWEGLRDIGAAFEGVARKHQLLPDSVRDSAWYSIVEDDWPRAKARLEQKIERYLR
jgi:hypothetical protein